MPEKQNNYSAKNIQVLEGLEAVRKRPGMYIGDVGKRGYHHLVWEIVDNAIDEALANYCDHITVTIHPKNKPNASEAITVEDNGRGIPIGKHSKTGLSALETVLTILHAGGKFGEGAYKVSGGLHGVGAACVNALSETLIATVYRDGKQYRQTYAKGKAQHPIQEIGTTDQRGTTIHFRPDTTIFEVHQYDHETIAQRLRELSFLNPGLTIDLIDQRQTNEEGNHPQTTFYAERGLPDFIAYLDQSRDAIIKEPIQISTVKDHITLDVAINYNSSHAEHIVTYANNITTFEGGTHLVGMKKGLTRAIKNHAAKTKRFEKEKVQPTGDDCRQGATIIVSIKLPDPRFSGQEKTKLTNSKVAKIVEQATYAALEEYLEQNKVTAEVIMRKVILAAEQRQAAQRARELVVQRKSSLLSSALPGTLTDCIVKEPAKSELFILEGTSAAGTAKGGRDRNTQAILPLRGKILNVEKAVEHKIYQNEQIKNIITALGITFKDTEEGRIANLDKLRYHKIIIMTDADVDGSHICTLILTFFYRYLPNLIQSGYLYIAVPPLYLVTKGTKYRRYCWTEEEKAAAIAEFESHGKGAPHAQRFKGLGEMEEDQLWDTTLNPEERVLKQVTIESLPEADRIVSILMGDNVEFRREMIKQNAKDIDTTQL